MFPGNFFFSAWDKPRLFLEASSMFPSWLFAPLCPRGGPVPHITTCSRLSQPSSCMRPRALRTGHTPALPWPGTRRARRSSGPQGVWGWESHARQRQGHRTLWGQRTHWGHGRPHSLAPFQTYRASGHPTTRWLFCDDATARAEGSPPACLRRRLRRGRAGTGRPAAWSGSSPTRHPRRPGRGTSSWHCLTQEQKLKVIFL